MTKISLAKFRFTETPKKYCRLILNEESPSVHRLVETKEGHLEYRLGAGKFKDVDVRSLRTLIRSIVQATKSHQIEHLAIELSKETFPKLKALGEDWFASTIVENILLADYEYTRYKTKEKKKKVLAEVALCGLTSRDSIAGFKRGEVLASYINRARDIANTPGCDMTPSDLASAAKKLLSGTKTSVKVLGEKELKKLKMGALLAVGQGTKSETKFIIVEYWGGKSKKDKPVVLIGKGITYDTGGLNVKPSGFMHEEHMDLSGGTSVLAAIAAAAKLGIKQNVIALVPSAENAISDDAMRAGDIVTSMSGQTIEVLHTDAEGRLILADALTYADRYQPKAILDVATLTGAALVALGQHASAIMSKDERLILRLRELGEVTGDLVWPLPLWDEYRQYLKSSRADVSNIAVNFSKWGGTIEGGVFLSFFAPQSVPWVHIDSAPRRASIPSDKLAKGSTGEPIRLLVSYLESL